MYDGWRMKVRWVDESVYNVWMTGTVRWIVDGDVRTMDGWRMYDEFRMMYGQCKYDRRCMLVGGWLLDGAICKMFDGCMATVLVYDGCIINDELCTVMCDACRVVGDGW